MGRWRVTCVVGFGAGLCGGGEEVFVLVHFCEEVEVRDVGGRLVAELVVVFEGGSVRAWARSW